MGLRRYQCAPLRHEETHALLAIKDWLALLDRWPLWKAVRGTPARLDVLERRVAELEEKLGDIWPPDVCLACGERCLRLYSTSLTPKGQVIQNWQCFECEGTEQRLVNPR